MKYQTKPQPVDAIHWQGEDVEGLKRVLLMPSDPPAFQLEINTPDGVRYAVKGDWIVIDSAGILTIVKDDEFHKKYESTPETITGRLSSRG